MTVLTIQFISHIRNTHIQECMNHSDKEAFLPGLREELNKTLSSAMTDYGNNAILYIFPVSVSTVTPPSPSCNILRVLSDSAFLSCLAELQSELWAEQDSDFH